LVDWLCRNKTELTFLLLVGIFVNVACYLQKHGICLTFFDTDDYMRLVRVKELFYGQNWNNNIIYRCNVPFGCNLHWTRFYDFFIVIPVYVLNFFINSIDKSVEYVGFVISPIVKSVTIAIAFNIAQKIMKKDVAFLCTALLAAHPFILPFGLFGRPDHHAFIMLFMIIFIHNVIEIVQYGFKNRKSYIKAAISSALCIWISPETLIPLLLTDAILFIYSFGDMEKLRNLYIKNSVVAGSILIIISFPFGPIADHAISMLIVLTTISYITFKESYRKDPVLRIVPFVTVLLMWLLFPRFTIEYDKISSVHLSLYICSAVFFCCCMVWNHSRCMILGAFFIIACVYLQMYPRFFCGMSADIDDYVRAIWFSRVGEMRSPLLGSDALCCVCNFIIIGSTIFCKIKQLSAKNIRVNDIIYSPIWWIFIVSAACYTIFSMISYRMLPYSALFGLPIVVDFGMNGPLTKSFHKYSRMIIAAFLSTLFVFCTTNLTSKGEGKRHTYTTRELYKVIDDLSTEPVVIMAGSNYGPAILYYTKHKAVGAPYHRQVQGIISSHKIMEESCDENEIKSILKTTDSSYIFIEKSEYKNCKTKNLANLIVTNQYPKWISIVPVPEKFNDIIIAKIDKTLMNQE